jgi:hypothetical protein
MWYSINGASQDEMWTRTLNKYMTMANDQHPPAKGKIERKRFIGKESSHHLFPSSSNQPTDLLCTSPTYPSGTPFPPTKFQVHADSLHFCAGGLFQAASPLLHMLIEQDTLIYGEQSVNRRAGSNTKIKSASSSTGIDIRTE